MKVKILYFIIITGLIQTACSNNSFNKKGDSAHELKILKQAYDYGDFGTAIYATHSLLAQDTAQVQYLDTLALLYFNSQNYPQAIKAANTSMAKKGESNKMLVVVANSFKLLGRKAEALPYFLKLAEQTKNPTYQYEIAVLNFYDNNYDEAMVAIQNILSTQGAEKYFVNISFGEQQSQAVPLKAAILNLLGFISQKKNNLEDAKKYYNESLAVYPDFVLAKNNLGSLEKK